MKRSFGLKRRTVLAAAAALPVLSCGGRAGRQYRFLTEQEAVELGAICDCLIPPDKDAGAAQAGVVKFIDLQLKGHYKKHQTVYTQGLRAIEETARRAHQRGFRELPGEKQRSLLEGLERNEGAREVWGELAPKQFFEMVLAHTMQGFYGSPRHGGNRDETSWKMLGVANPPVRGRLHYEV